MLSVQLGAYRINIKVNKLKLEFFLGVAQFIQLASHVSNLPQIPVNCLVMSHHPGLKSSKSFGLSDKLQ